MSKIRIPFDKWLEWNTLSLHRHALKNSMWWYRTAGSRKQPLERYVSIWKSEVFECGATIDKWWATFMIQWGKASRDQRSSSCACPKNTMSQQIAVEKGTGLQIWTSLSYHWLWKIMTWKVVWVVLSVLVLYIISSSLRALSLLRGRCLRQRWQVFYKISKKNWKEVGCYFY